jgi:hypothetical protein
VIVGAEEAALEVCHELEKAMPRLVGIEGERSSGIASLRPIDNGDVHGERASSNQ